MKAIYALFEDEIAQDEWEYTDEFKADLDRRFAYYKNGGKMVSAKEADKQINELFKSFVRIILYVFSIPRYFIYNIFFNKKQSVIR